jgi:rod shape-determining protein MreD
MRLRPLVLVITMLVIAVVLQTTLFSQTTIFIPDLVMLLIIVLALTRVSSEAVLATAFVSGVVVDLLGSSVLGLRALVFTVAGYLALRTRDRADIGRVITGLWAGLVTLAGVVMLILIGTLFGQTVLLGEGVVERLVLVPLANSILAVLFAPVMVRIIDRDATAFRYT